MGRPPIAPGERMVTLELYLTDQEKADLFTVAQELGHRSASDFVREAVNEAVADYRERRVFQRRTAQIAVRVERRRGDRRAPETST